MRTKIVNRVLAALALAAVPGLSECHDAGTESSAPGGDGGNHSTGDRGESGDDRGTAAHDGGEPDDVAGADQGNDGGGDRDTVGDDTGNPGGDTGLPPGDAGPGGDAAADFGTPSDPCDGIRAAGFEVCESSATTCSGVYNNHAGCTAFCAAAGMVCLGSVGGNPGCVKEPQKVVPCDSGNNSDWCDCEFAAPDGGTPDTGAMDAGVTDAGADAGTPDAGQTGLPQSRLPFGYTRPDTGSPVTAQELSDVTDLYLELLEKARYFDSVDERVHGWPEGDPQKRYWYGTWWSGAGIHKKNGQISFVHVDVGADNNGLRTAQVMEAACYAYLFWGKPAHERLLRKTIRGFNSWIMAIERKPGDAPVMLSRAAYLDNITASDDGKTYTIDYSTNRPGVDNGATEYVNVPANPHWGNIWIKNKRSKDCLGHMFRGIGQMESCAARLSGDGAAQLSWMRDKYGAWGRQVEADGWKIATLDKNLNVYIPTDDLANFYTIGGVECAGQLMLRLMGHGDAGTLACGSGISSLESAAYFNAGIIKTGNKEMAHVYHEAAVNQALVAGQNTTALDLVKGMTDRLDRTMNYIDQNGKVPDNVNDGMVTSLILHAANAGVPLTSREVRWVHDHIRAAHASYLDPSKMPQYDIYNTLPEGEWAFSPDGDGIQFNNIGLPLGSCASVFRNPAGRPILDCDKVLRNPR